MHSQGDKIVLTVANSTLSQLQFNPGVYALCHNYSSLVARIVFLPVEDVSKTLFSKLAINISSLEKRLSVVVVGENVIGGKNEKNDIVGKNNREIGDDREEKLQIEEKLSTSLNELLCLLMTMLTFIFVFSILFPLFASRYIRILVTYVLGSKWNSDDTLSTFSAFCNYIFVLGINGLSESFVHAVSTPAVLSGTNISLMSSSIVFYLSAHYFITTFGTQGVVLANILGMLIRILCNALSILAYCRSCIFRCELKNREKYSQSLWTTVYSSIKISWSEILIVVALACVTCVSEKRRYRWDGHISSGRDDLVHLAAGGFVFLILLCVYYKFHFQEWKLFVNKMKLVKVD